ncbi:aldose 1-epimerase family protein [Allostella humosa]|nr:aldose 1-epimerase family protein [Stella humosa]
MPNEDLIHLECGPARATIAIRGAEPVAWRVGDVPLLWTADPAWWARTSPILFPVVGWSRGGAVRIDGTAYPMPVHGFAAGSGFTVVDHAADRVRLELTDGDGTRRHYPFAFRLTVEWRLAADRMDGCLTVDNPGERAMPYAVGLHPGFSWPLAGAPRDGHRVVFERVEPGTVPVIAPGGLFSTARRPVPLRDGRVLALDDALFAKDALCFLDAASHHVRFENGQGQAITVASDDFPHLALWSRPGAPFLSVESWTGHGDPVDFSGELIDRPSMRLLAAGASVHHRLSWLWEDGSAP